MKDYFNKTSYDAEHDVDMIAEEIACDLKRLGVIKWKCIKDLYQKNEATEFQKKVKGILSYERSEIEKRSLNPIWIRDCKKYFGLPDKYKYVVIYKV